MFEYYPASRCGLVSYLVVADEARRRGMGRMLVDKGLAMLSDAAREDGAELRATFAECVDPRRAATDAESAAWRRIEILGRLNARILDVPYTAPALGPGRERARDLLLLYLPADPDDPAPLPSSTLVDFLRELYVALDVPQPDSDPDYESTIRALPDRHVPTVQIRRELPALSLPALTIALHFVRTKPKPRAGEPVKVTLPSDEIFNSFERDLVSHAYRDGPPFASETLRQPFVTDVHFPAEVDIRSEGSTIRLCAAAQDERGGGRRRHLRVVRSRTVFDDHVVVDHLVLTNLGLADSVLNEYDVVKLLKLHGGGESSDIGGRLRFSTPEGEVFEFPAWLDRLEGSATDRPWNGPTSGRRRSSSRPATTKRGLPSSTWCRGYATSPTRSPASSGSCWRPATPRSVRGLSG